MSNKVKSISAVFMAICMAVTMSSTSLFAVIADAVEKSEIEQAKDVEESKDESTTEETKEESSSLGWYDSQKDTFTIESEDDLVLLAEIVNGTAEDAAGNKVQDSFKGKTIVLADDLDLEGVEINPIGTKENPFEGTFNGQNNKISNLSIISENDYQGLFGYNKGTIKKLYIKGSVTGANYVSAVAGYNTGKIQSVKSNTTIEASGDNVGAIAGKNDGIVDRCSNSANLTANHFLGGIVGYNTATVSKSYNTGNITGTGTNEVYNTLKGVGGVTGVSYGINDWKCKIDECYNTGTINGHYMVGGVTAWTQNATVINSYNTGNVTGVWDIGGVSGAVKGSNTTDTLLSNCYNTGHIKSTKEYAGGIAGFVWACTLDNCYNSGEITGVSENGGIFGGDYHGGGGLVKNCKTTGRVNAGNYTGNVFGWSSGVSQQDNEYFDPTSENFEKIVGLLNAQVTTDNGYLGWKYENNAITQTKVYDVEFDLSPSDATVVVKNSEGNEINASDEGIYALANGTYTYEVSKENYESKTNTFTVNNSGKNIYVKLIKSSDLWDGESANTDWYNDTDSSFNISTNSQLAGLIKLIYEGKDFTSKTIVLSNDINLNNKALLQTDKEFNGTFDGASYFVEGLNGSLFKNLGKNATIINLGIRGNGEIVNTNKGTVVNSYSLADSSLVSNNEGVVKNCYSSSNKPIVKSGTQALDSYYIDGDIYKNEDLINSKIADLLNKNVNSKNSTYYSWAVLKGETVLTKSYKATFKIVGENGDIDDASITLYDSNNNEVNKNTSKNFMTDNNIFRLINGKYSYTISRDGYTTKKGTLRINGKDETIQLTLPIAYKISFAVEPSDATVVVKNSQNKIINVENGVYLLEKGDYTYQVFKEGYWTEKGSFTATKDGTINVNLSKTYDVVFKLNIENPTGLKINVKTESKEDVASEEDGLTYKLKDGKYTYNIKVTGYKEVTGEIQVSGQQITKEINLEVTYDTSWYDSTKDSFTITNGSQLAGLAVLVNGVNSDAVNFEGKTITLANDIQLAEGECDWLPVGTNKAYFKGNFDGAKHTISNLVLNRADDTMVGLFGKVSSATLKNITLEGNIKAKTNVGALAGAVYDNSIIENCINKVDISAGGYVGGLIGSGYKSDVKNCINEGKIEATEGKVGGIGGYFSDGVNEISATPHYISNCKNNGTIISKANNCGGILGSGSIIIEDSVNNGNVQGTMYIGGIAGSISNANILNSYNTGFVTGGSQGSTVYIGGIAGQFYSGSSRKIYTGNCYNLGEIKTSGKGAGGIVGFAYNYMKNGEVYNCYNLGVVSAESNSASIVGMDYNSNIHDCYYLNTTETDKDKSIFKENGSKTETEFKDGTVADLLNKNVTAQNKFKLWEVVDNVTTFSDKEVNILSFNISPSDATVTLKDSNNQIISKLNDKTYINLKENEKYTYTIERENYITKTGEFTYTSKNNIIDVTLNYIPTKIVFNTTPKDSKVTVYDKSNKVIEVNEDGSYTLIPGQYKYYVEAEGYGPKIQDFTIEEVNQDTTKEISVELEKAYNVSIKTNSTTDENITVKDKDKNIINPNEDKTYALAAGTYSYYIVADGYEAYTGSFEVVDKDIEIYQELVKVYDLSWYDKDKTELIIKDAYQLKGFNAIIGGKTTSVAKDTFKGKTIKLANDIELNSKDLFIKDENGKITVSSKADKWSVISVGANFAGTFDGQGHSINGIYKTGMGGIFPTVSGTIKDLTVSGYVKATMRGAGIAYQGTATARFENCVNKCTIDGKGQSAGIVAYGVNATIINCINEGYVIGSSQTGGIAGLASSSTIINCVNEGKVEATTDASGIAYSGKKISNCYNLGEVTAPTAAGISNTGTANNTAIDNCVNYGKVTGTTVKGAISIKAVNDNMTNNYYQKNSCSQGVEGDDVEGKVEVKTAKQLADGSVAALLNAKVTNENEYKSWTVIDGKTVFGSYDLAITPSVTGATVKLYDYKGNEIKAIAGTTGVFDGLRKGSLYKYEVTKEGLNTETGTVIMGSTPQAIYVELSVTVYVTVSKDGEFKLADDQDTKLTRIPVTTTNFDVTDYGYPSVYNNDSYPTLLNVFIRFHELYSGGADNFAGTPNNTPAKGNDLFITKFIGIETTQLNYYVNNKYPGEWLEDKGYIWGSTADYIKMKNNDDVNVVMFTNYQTPMFYTYFDKQEATVKQGQNLELTLKGFDNANAYMSPESKNISGSTIYIDGEETEIVTDKDGKAILTFDEPGTYIISAQGTDLSLSDSEKTVITAPVCEVTVTEADDITVSFDADNGDDIVTKAMKPGKVLNYMSTAPTKEGYTFVGWYKDTDDITTEYKQGSRFTQSTTYKAKYAHVTMLGAQGKMVSNGKSGIRFGTKIYNDGDEIVEKGTLILPANLLAEGETLTLDTPNVAKSVANTLYEVNKEQNYLTYLGTIVNIPKAQFERQMTASAYVVYKDKAGHQYTVYAPYANGSISVLDLLGNDVDWGEDW